MDTIHEATDGGELESWFWSYELISGATEVTPGLWRALGYSGPLPSSLPDWIQLADPEDLGPAEDRVAEVLNGTRESLHLQFRARDNEGNWRHFEARGRELRRASEPVVLAGVITDITARHEREELARTKDARLASAQQAAGAGTWEVDLDTGALVLDRASLRMHGLPESTGVMTVDQWASTLDDRAQEALAAFSKAVDLRGQYSFEYSTQGGKFWILGVGATITDSHGKPMRMVGLNLDRTEWKKAEQLIERMRGELAQLARTSAMGNMASTIAHELNQPLAATANYLGVADMYLEQGKPESAAAAVQSAKVATLKAGDIIRRIREGMVSRHGTARKADLAAVIESALVLATIDAEQRAVKIERKMADNLSVVMDPIQIEQVVINLVRNAMDAVDGVNHPTVLITAFEEAGNAVVEVEDNGRGIPPEMAPGVFDTFTSSKEHGMGLGLSICRTIIEAHEGRITLKETSPSKTTFRFDLPLALEQPEAANEQSL